MSVISHFRRLPAYCLARASAIVSRRDPPRTQSTCQTESAISVESISLTRGLTLWPMTEDLASLLGPAVASMEPWSQIDYPGSLLTAFLSAEDFALSRHAVFIGEAPAGVIAIRSPWLHGPYLQLLAVLPPFQSQGFGAILLDWFESRATPQNRWLWLCHSSFNIRAGAFYTRHGYQPVTALTNLMNDDGDEILMRKRIKRRP